MIVFVDIDETICINDDGDKSKARDYEKAKPVEIRRLRFPSISLRFPFGPTSISLRFHFELTSISL